MKYIHLILNDLSTPDFFDVIISGEQVVRQNPDPEVFLKAARRMSLVPHRCLVFEDSAPGIAAPKKAGIKAIGITNTLPISTILANKEDQRLIYLLTNDRFLTMLEGKI